MNEKIWLSAPHMSGEELKFIQEAFDTNWISPVGPHIAAFESELSSYADVPHCAVLNSGTSAIHLALIILGVQRDDEVICSSFTFSGSCNPVVYCGATPVFVDSEDKTWNMDPDLLREAIVDRERKTGKLPKAIILVHLYGMPAQMDSLMKVAREFEIPVIEDAAEALGSKYKGKKLGGFGDFGVFSFNGNKIITSAGGGALLSGREEWIKKARFLATQARDPAPHYQHTEIGYNYRLSNVSAGIGRGQLTVLDQRVRQRRQIYETYRNALEGRPGISFLSEPEAFFSNRWLTTVLLESTDKQVVMRQRIQDHLDNQNIESRPLWKPMHIQPVFKHCSSYGGKVSERLFSKGLCLPSTSSLTSGQVTRIITHVKAALEQ